MMQRIDTIKLTTTITPENPVLHDLELDEGQLVFVSGKEAIAQKCEERLKFFKGEWYQDQNEGLPYFSHILIKNPSLPAIKSIITKALNQIRGVQHVDEVEVTMDKASRELSIFYRVTTNANDTIESRTMLIGVPDVR
jgi:hypothetical protein